jgi:hypothetical protein
MADVQVKRKKRSGRKQKRDQALSAAERAREPRVDKEMFSRFDPYIATLYCPEEPRNALAPHVKPHPGDTRRKPFDITMSSSGANETVVFKMYPRLSDTIMKNKGGTVPTPDTMNQVFIDFEDAVSADSVIGTAGRNILAQGGRGTKDFELPMTTVSLGGRNSMVVESATPAASALNVMYVNKGDYGVRVNPYYRDAVTGVWTALATLAVPAGATVPISSGAIANGTSGYGFNVHNTAAASRFIKLSVVQNCQITGITTPALTYPASPWSSESAVIDAQALDEFRTVAMSMKLTWLGDLTTAAGRVACALVPREFVPDPDDVVGSIARLPIGAYDGQLKEGCHIIWQPRTEDDFKYQACEFDRGSYYIIIAALLAQPNTPIRLKASYNYEIFTLDPTIANMRFCPSAFGLDEVTQVVFENVPPGSSNDGHKSKLAAAMAVARKIANMPLQWVRENPEKAMEVGLGIATKLLAL